MGSEVSAVGVGVGDALTAEAGFELGLAQGSGRGTAAWSAEAACIGSTAAVVELAGWDRSGAEATDFGGSTSTGLMVAGGVW